MDKEYVMEKLAIAIDARKLERALQARIRNLRGSSNLSTDALGHEVLLASQVQIERMADSLAGKNMPEVLNQIAIKAATNHKGNSKGIKRYLQYEKAAQDAVDTEEALKSTADRLLDRGYRKYIIDNVGY